MKNYYVHFYRLLLLIGTLLMSSCLYAATPGYTGYFRVQGFSLDADKDDNALLYIKVAEEDGQSALGSLGCDISHVVLSMEDKHSKERYSGVLTAMTTGKKIKLYVTSCNAVGYPVADNSRFIME